jgi:outer membrane lipoprotein-sorting protein
VSRRTVLPASFILSTLVLLTGCNRYYSPSTLSPAAFISQQDQSQSAIQSLQGWVKVQLQSSAGNYILAQKIYYSSPNRLRLEIAGILGIPVIMVVIDGNDFQFFIPVRNILIKGKTDELGPAFTINDLLQGFIYGHRLDLEQGQDIAITENSKAYKVTWHVDGQQNLAWVNKATKIITRHESRSLRTKEAVRTVERAGIIKVGDRYYPGTVSVYDRDLGQKVTFKFSGLSFNQKLDQDMFKLKLPAKYEEKKLSDFLQEFR